MRISQSHVIAAVLAIGGSISGEFSDVQACSCLPPPDTATSFNEAGAVFLGQVTNVGLPNGGDLFLMRPVTFRVIRSWKNVSGETVVVYTGMGGGDCGLGLEAGQEWLIYAGNDPTSNRLIAGICSRSRSIAVNATDCLEIAELDAIAVKTDVLACEHLLGKSECTPCGTGCLIPLFAMAFLTGCCRSFRPPFVSATR